MDLIGAREIHAFDKDAADTRERVQVYTSRILVVITHRNKQTSQGDHYTPGGNKCRVSYGWIYEWIQRLARETQRKSNHIIVIHGTYLGSLKILQPQSCTTRGVMVGSSSLLPLYPLLRAGTVMLLSLQSSFSAHFCQIKVYMPGWWNYSLDVALIENVVTDPWVYM